MRFQVGKFVCELSRNHTGKVLATWFRRAEPPKYLNRGERGQYRAGRAAFLEHSLGRADGGRHNCERSEIST
jgi:hypothetical protein